MLSGTDELPAGQKEINSIRNKKGKANYEKKRRGYLEAVLNAFIYKVNIDRIEEAGSRKNLSPRTHSRES